MRRIITALAATAVITAGLAGAAATGAAATDRQDIVLVVDSTGLTQGQWAIQQRAYLAALDDRTQFPLDGSVAVSFVQYAVANGGGQASRVTVPLTVLNSEDALGKLTASIRAATLLTPDKVGIDGLSAAAQELSDHGSKGSPASVCLTANAPWNSDTLAKGTSATKAAGATRLGVLTLTTSALSSALASQQFTSAIVGDGQVISARDVPQFGSLISSSCRLPALRLEAIEVNQVIQDWKNSMPLVEHKDTFVRVFLESVMTPSAIVSGLLHGERDGVELSGSPLSPINSSSAALIDGNIDNEADRRSINTSLNFQLPTSWLSGDVTLTFEAPATMSCSSAPAAARDCDVDVSFQPAEEPSVDYVSVPYESDGTRREPTDAALVETMYRTEDNFPTRYVDFDFDWLPWLADDTKPDLELVNAYLTLYSLYEDCSTTCAMYYGIMDGAGGGLANGIPGTAASGFLSGTGATEAYGYGRNRGPHEIAHMLGAHHIVNKAENGMVGTSKSGWCTEEGSTSAPEFPYWFWSTIKSRDYPSFGPMGAADDEIWGFSPRFVDVNASLAVSDPYEVFPLMSYCSAIDTTSQYRWPSKQTYDVLADVLLDGSRSRSVDERTTKPAPFIVVRGLVDPTAPNATRFLPVAPVTMHAPAASTGDWSLRLLDVRGKTIATRSFSMTQPHGDAVEPNSGEPTARQQFAVPFPASVAGKISTIQLRRGQRVIASERASIAAPQVAISSPKTGSSLDGQTVTVAWTTQDADSSTLSSTVLYRPSPRSTWKPIAIDAAGTSVTVPRRALAGSRTGQFMVIASDGIRFTTATVNAVRVADNPPLLSLESSDDVSYSGGQNFDLSAVAWDAEDGTLDQQITWTSNLDGVIDTGRHINLLATDLSEGAHIITVQAKDSAGNVASTTMKVTISRVYENFQNK